MKLGVSRRPRAAIIAACVLAACVLAACGGAPAPAPATPPPKPAEPPPPVESADAKRARITAEHHALEDEQATAFAASCSDPPTAHAHKRCAPSCYDGEPPDPRAGKPVHAPMEIDHVLCTADGAADGPYAITDELATTPLRASRGRAPAAATKGSWQAAIEADAATELRPLLARGDVVRVIGAWKHVVHPITQEPLRCVTVVHYARAMRRPLDACGGHGDLGCEAANNAAAHGIDVVHYRLAEARRLHAAHDDAGCQAAALEAFAVARGLPRWRQYAKLNTTSWVAVPRYRTRFDGVLDEDALFAAAAAHGGEAEQLYGECAGTAPHTTAAQEQSFHTCW